MWKEKETEEGLLRNSTSCLKRGSNTPVSLSTTASVRLVVRL